MSKKKLKAIIKWSLIGLSGLIVTIVALGYWFISLLPTPTITKEELQKTKPSELLYLTQDQISNRGRILAVVTSTDKMGSTEKSTGYELTELARAYYVFQANGFEVDIASPLGGNPPVVIDGDDMKEFDYAFLNDDEAQKKVQNTMKVQSVNPEVYEAIYFVGGKGAMFDFPQNEHIQSIVRDLYESGKVVGAVCHGPAALVNVTLSNGMPLVQNKKLSSFTNQEELLLIPDAEEIFPFLLQDKLVESGAKFEEGALYLNKVSVVGNLVTGQNPWSTWTAAESVVRQIGYEVKDREITAEENSISILNTYDGFGYEEAKKRIENYCSTNPLSIDRELLAIHSLVAGMQLDLGKTVELIQLLKYSNTYILK